MLAINAILDAKNQGLRLPSAITIGNFDGCHLGHQELIAQTKDFAEKLSASATALTFDPRPESFFQKTPDLNLLFNPRQKLAAFKELGLDACIIQKFNEDFAKVDATHFLEHHLINQLDAKAIVVGGNFRFGRGREGNIDVLKQIAHNHMITAKICEDSCFEKQTISSSRIRNALHAGDVRSARAMLGRPYLLEGEIVKGEQVGRKLKAPTANLSHMTQLVPAIGVYFVRVVLEADAQVLTPRPDALPAICSISYRPTLAVKTPVLSVEAHILAGSYPLDSLYGLKMGIYFDDKLREPEKYASFEELKQAIARDIAQARHYYQLSN